jgi:heptosyltransferase-2
VTLQKKIEKALGDFLLTLFRFFVLNEEYPVDKIEHKNIHSILVVLRHQMGDMLCASPMLNSLKNYYPQAHITLVTKESTNYEKIFTGENTIANEVKNFEYGLENFVVLIRELKERRFDLAIVPSTVVFSATNHLIAYFSRAKIRVGVSSINYNDNKTSYLLNVRSDFFWETKKIHQVEKNLDIIRQLNIVPGITRIKLKIDAKNKEFAEKYLKDNFPDLNRPIIGVHPGAAKENNIWKISNFAELLNRLYNKFECNIFISVGPHDARYSEELKRILAEKYKIRNIASHRGILMNNMGIINLTDLFITNDTGVMHLASGLDIPVIALFGPTKANEWGPLGGNKVSIQSVSTDINEITVEQVNELSSRFLNMQIFTK